MHVRRRYLLLPVLVALALTVWAYRGIQHDDTIRANGEALTGRIVSISSIPRTQSAKQVQFELPNGYVGSTRVDSDIARRYAVGQSIDVHRLGDDVVADDSLDADTWFGYALALDLFVALGVVIVLLPARKKAADVTADSAEQSGVGETP